MPNSEGGALNSIGRTKPVARTKSIVRSESTRCLVLSSSITNRPDFQKRQDTITHLVDDIADRTRDDRSPLSRPVCSDRTSSDQRASVSTTICRPRRPPIRWAHPRPSPSANRRRCSLLAEKKQCKERGNRTRLRDFAPTLPIRRFPTIAMRSDHKKTKQSALHSSYQIVS